MSTHYYTQLTRLLRRKGIDDTRIVSTLNDVKGWISQHPDERPEEHFGPAGELVRDLPKGNAVHAPQKLLAGGITIGLLLIFAQMIAGFFKIALVFLGLPAPLWGLIAIVVGFIASRFVGGEFPEGFKP